MKDHISAGRAFLISCKGQMASVDDTQPFKGPPLPPPGLHIPTACHVSKKPFFTALAPSH